jgi:DNA invertase Pin-like site-specific DNA recombinase
MNSPGKRPGSVPAVPIGAQASAPRAAVYLRVSTGRQAEQDLSIPDQKAQTRVWATQRGWSVVAEYVEPGASATDDKRPEFQRMIERACDGENAFDVIVVHSFSRFFRDAFGLEFYVGKLTKHGVRLVSISSQSPRSWVTTRPKS